MIDRSAVRGWIRRHPGRFLLYASLLAAMLAAAVAIPVLGCTHDGLGLWLANRPFLHHLSEDLGVAYAIESLSISCRPLTAELSGIDLKFKEEPATTHIERIELPLGLPVSVHGIRLATVTTPDVLTIDGVHADLAQRRTDVSGIRVPFDDQAPESYLFTHSVLVDGVTLVRSSQSLAVDHLAVDKVEVSARRGADGNWSFTRMPMLRALGQNLSRQGSLMLDRANQMLPRFRRLLVWVLAGAALSLLLVKLLVTRSPRSPRAVFTVLFVLVPFVCYALLFGHVSLVMFLVLSALISFVLAVLLLRTAYRFSAEWHQRWEPFALDVLAPMVLLPLLVIYGIVPASLSAPSSFNIARMSVQNTNIAVYDPAGEGDLASLSIPQFEDEGFALKLGQAGRGSVNLGLASFGGSVQGHASSLLRRLEWLPASWSKPHSITFCGTVRDRALPAARLQAEGCAANGSRFPNVRMNILAGILLSPFEVNYSTKTQTRFEPILLTFVAEGNERAVRIRNLESLENSGLQIARGEADITFIPAISASLSIGALRAQAARVVIDAHSLKAHVSVSSLVDPANLQVGLQLRGSAFRASELSVTIGGTNVDCTLKSGHGDRLVATRAVFRDVVVTSRHAAEPDPWLRTELPAVILQSNGQMSPGTIPHNYTGAVTLRLARSTDPHIDYENTALWADNPVHFTIDPWKGAFDVPYQSLTIHQSLVSAGSMSLDLAVEGQIVSLAAPARARAKARFHVSRLAPDLPLARLQLNDIDVLARMAVKGGPTSLNAEYGSGWSTATLKDTPATAPELREISEFNVETHGSFPRTPGMPVLRSGGFASLLKPMAFKLTGVLPASPDVPSLQVVTRSGAGLHISSITTAVGQLWMPDLRLETLGVKTAVSGIKTASGNGDLSLRSEILIDKGSLHASTVIPFSNNGGSLALKLERTPEVLHVELADKLAIGPLLSSIEPFLEQASLSLQGVTSKAEVNAFEATARFSGPELIAVEAALDVPPGLLASADLSKLSRRPTSVPFQRMEIWLPSDPATSGGLQLRASPAVGPTPRSRSTDVAFTLNRLSFLGIDEEARQYSAELSLASKINLALPSNGLQSTHPLREKLALSAFDFRGHAQRAMQSLGNFGTKPAPHIRDVTWKLEVHNPSMAEPLFSIGQDKASFALRAGVAQIGWRTSEGGGVSEVSSSMDVATDFRMHHGELVADGYVPIQVRLSLAGRPAQKIALRLPFLTILAERLHPADAASDWLWDTKYYDSFWSDYQPSRSNRGPASIIDIKELVLGGLSIQQLRIPSEPLRIAIGHQGRLQFDAPANSQLLFGKAQGRVQAEIWWQDSPSSPSSPGEAPGVLLDSRAAMIFSHLQMGAIRRSVPDGGLPFIEDELDGQVNFRTDAYSINSVVLSRLASGFARPEDLQGLSAKVKFWSARPNPLLPGAVQAITTAELQNLNDFLKQISRDLQLLAPPRSIVYRSLLFNFDTTKGQVITEPSLLELRGMNLFSDQQLEVDGTMRVHLGGKGETFTLQDLTSLGRRLVSVQAGNWGRQ